MKKANKRKFKGKAKKEKILTPKNFKQTTKEETKNLFGFSFYKNKTNQQIKERKPKRSKRKQTKTKKKQREKRAIFLGFSVLINEQEKQRNKSKTRIYKGNEVHRQV